MHENVAMPEPTTIDISDACSSEAPPEGARPAAPYSYTYDELLRFYWPPIVLRIIFAGGCYPVLVAVGFLSIQLWEAALGRGGVDISGIIFVTLPLYALLLAAVGVMWASIVTIVTLPAVHLVAWSLRLQTGLVWLGAFSGGLVGFVAFSPLKMDLPNGTSSQQLWEAITVLAVGPGLTTILGQLGGAFGGRKAAKRAIELAEQYERLMAVGWRRESARSEVEGAEMPALAHEPQYQFRIAHLLWVGVWLSLLLTVIRLAGIPYEFILPLLLGWLVFQAATLWIGWQLVRQVGPWWTRRGTIRRST